MPKDKPQTPPPTKPSGATPYRPSATKFTGPRADIISLAVAAVDVRRGGFAWRG